MSDYASDYEPVMQALFDLLADGDYATASRRLQHWSQVEEQPALFLRRTGVIYQTDMLMTMRTLVCEAWIYCNTGRDPDASPDETLTRLEAALLAKLAPDCRDDDEARFTLGGQVYHCRVEGRSDMSPGDQAGQAIMRVPILITLP